MWVMGGTGPAGGRECPVAASRGCSSAPVSRSVRHALTQHVTDRHYTQPLSLTHSRMAHPHCPHTIPASLAPFTSAHTTRFLPLSHSTYLALPLNWTCCCLSPRLVNAVSLRKKIFKKQLLGVLLGAWVLHRGILNWVLQNSEPLWSVVVTRGW
jgi:hypothetical protein